MKHTLFIALFIGQLAASAQQLYPVKVKDKWGYTSPDGKMIIPARYDYAEGFNDGRAVVMLNNQPCVISAANKRIIDTGLYINISRFSEGLAKVTDADLHQQFVDLNGKLAFVLSPDVYDARPFKNGLSAVARKEDFLQQKFGREISNLGYRFGYMNRKGEIVVPCTYDDVDDFSQGYARVKEGMKTGVMDSNGTVVIKPTTYFNLGRFVEGKAVADAGGKYGFIDEKGNEVIKAVYQYAYDFSEGMAGVSLDKKYGFVNDKGELVIKPEYESIRPFSGGMAAVKKDGKWGFIDKTGTPKLRFVFDDAAFFSEGLCAVLIKRKWGFIDERGALVIPAEFDAVGTFSNGLAEVMARNISVYINRQGRVIPDLKE